MLPFRVVGIADNKKLLGLADSGSNRTYLDSRLAPLLGVEFDESSRGRVGLGGGNHDARQAEVTLVLGQHSWESSVYFVDGWNHSHMVLGLKDLFDLFVVRFDVEAEITDVTPRRNASKLKRIRR